MSDQTRRWTNHDGGYFVCSHCAKKANPDILDHDCCGRCWQGRIHLKAAQESYDGPGTFAHGYWETVLQPGKCATCGEARQVHRR